MMYSINLNVDYKIYCARRVSGITIIRYVTGITIIRYVTGITIIRYVTGITIIRYAQNQEFKVSTIDI
jgi:hypothetical protein